MARMILFIDAAGILAGLFLLVLLVQHLRLALRARSYRPPPEVPAPACDILVQIPLYNEAASLQGALASAVALEWPAERLTIQLLDDSDDETSLLVERAIAELPSGGALVEHLRRKDRQGFKAGALAAGMARNAAPLIAILDADFRAPPAWLRLAARALAADERAGFAQFRFEFSNRNRNWMTRGQQLSVDAHFLAEQAGRQAGGDPFQFNGTAAVWRRAAIAAAGGWSDDTLAEDLDLTFRSQAAGWHGLLLLEPALFCEAPADLQAWRVQQARWSAGFMQVARGALPLIWHSGWPLGARIGSSLLLGLQLGLPCFLIAGAAFLFDGLLRGFGTAHAFVALLAAFLAVLGAVAITYPPYRRLRRGGILRYAATLAAIPILMAIMAVANSSHVLSAPFGRRRDFIRTPKTGDGTPGS